MVGVLFFFLALGIGSAFGDDQGVFLDKEPTKEDLVKALSVSPAIKTRGIKIGSSKTPVSTPPKVLLNIQFKYDSAELTDKAVATLTTVGQAISESSLRHFTFRIVGHTDAAGPAGYNLNLSLKRAQAVRNFLASEFDLSDNMFEVDGMGERKLLRPAAPLDSRNRRVEIANIGP
ncbi:OmpA family protein [Pseudodesulfovibrio portus]|nr:OmpA family protein [Pseudodesulfovibrio portus]